MGLRWAVVWLQAVAMLGWQVWANYSLNPEFCQNHPCCRHNQSNLCFESNTRSCNHQLLGHRSCTLHMLQDKCQLEAPSEVVVGEEQQLAHLTLYRYNTWMDTNGVTNFSFPSPSWATMKIQVEDYGADNLPLCMEVQLEGRSEPVEEVLSLDCYCMTHCSLKTTLRKVTLLTDQGQGQSFIFRIPDKDKIISCSADVATWETFFTVQADNLGRTSYTMVRVQVNQFPNLTYTVSLLRCGDHSTYMTCQHPTIVHSVNRTPVSDSAGSELMTVPLATWTVPGNYAVAVQLVSPLCPPTGCPLSLSPTFEVEPSQTYVWVTLGLCALLLFIVVFVMTFKLQQQRNTRVLAEAWKKPVKVLLVYLAETQKHLELVKTLAQYLEKCVAVKPFAIDTDVRSEDPDTWTHRHLSEADRVLFLVPHNSEADSFTPFRLYWTRALHFFSGEYILRHQSPNQAAVVLLPFSGPIPRQISHLCRLQLVGGGSQLVTWLHNGSVLDAAFLWGPIIHSPADPNKLTWKDVEQKALEAGSWKLDLPAPNSLGMPSAAVRKENCYLGQRIVSPQTHSHYTTASPHPILPSIPGLEQVLLDTDSESNSEVIDLLDSDSDTDSIIPDDFC